MERICIYCGSSPGAKPEYVEAARSLARALVRRKIGLVYGGGGVGLMGELARAALAAGGEVVGVITQKLVDMELACPGLSVLTVVDTMHERKARMAELSEGFIALPGGFGTLEELFEVLTWQQLGLHGKPCGVLNVAHYYDKMIEFLDVAEAEKFTQPVHRRMLLCEEDPERLLDAMTAYRAPSGDKGIWVRELSRQIKPEG
jgi:uncharacterized protein (TIGR00730 family)